MLLSRTLHWPHMDLGDNNRVISSVEPDSNRYSYLSICQCVRPQPVTQHQLHERRRKRERSQKIDKSARLKRHWGNCPFKGKRATLSWAGGGTRSPEAAGSVLVPSHYQTLSKPQKLQHTFHNTGWSNTCLSLPHWARFSLGFTQWKQKQAKQKEKKLNRNLSWK